MRRIDICVVAGVFIVMAVAMLFLVLTAEPAAAAFALGFALLFGVFLLASLFSARYGHREPQGTSEESGRPQT